MPRIFDNIDDDLLSALRDTLAVSNRADFCVGYFNLRGWKQLDAHIDRWVGAPGKVCRVLVGMQRRPDDELRWALSLFRQDQTDQQTVVWMKKRLAVEFRNQLMLGFPTNQDERALRNLARQLRENAVQVKLFLRHPLHAKLYLLFRADPINPIVCYLGSSNLTLPGLYKQGDLRRSDKKRGGVTNFFVHPDGRTTTVHLHNQNQTFKIGTLKTIIERQAQWDEDDLKRLKLLK